MRWHFVCFYVHEYYVCVHLCENWKLDVRIYNMDGETDRLITLPD